MDVNYRVVAFDPGGTTGWALYDAEYAETRLVEEKLTTGQFGPEEHHADLYQAIEEWHTHNFLVVYESFEFRQYKQRDNINLMSREYIGVIKAVCQDRHIRMVSQTAALGKGFVSDEKLHAMGWWSKGMKHANDATRHLVYYLVNKERRVDLIQSWRSLT